MKVITVEPKLPAAPEDFSLVVVGPLYQIYLGSGLLRPPEDLVQRRIIAFIVVTWLPLTFFMPQLARAKREAMREYGLLAGQNKLETLREGTDDEAGQCIMTPGHIWSMHK